MERFTFLSCEKTSDEATNIKSYLLRVPESIKIDEFKPGRFIVIDHPDKSGTSQTRNYSITALRDNNLIEITVKSTGKNGVSDSLYSNIRSGSLLCLTQVGGSITSDCILSYKHVMMLAGGIGITLPMALIRCLAHLKKEGERVPRVTLFVSSPTVACIPFLAELLSLEFGSDWFNVRFFITQEAIKKNSRHFTAGRLDRRCLLETAPTDAIVICGSHSFSATQQALITELDKNIPCYIEAFSSPERTAPEQSSGQHTNIAVRVDQIDYHFTVNTETTLLEALEANHITIRSQCRSGICGSCRIKVISGSCRREPDFSLSPAERESGYALACCSYAEGDELSIEV